MYISYKNILRTAWSIAWKNKIFWLFGIFASFLSLENVYEVMLSQISQVSDCETLYNSVLNLYANQSLFFSKSVYFLNLLPNDYSAYLLLTLICALIALFIWLALVSQIVIIKGSYTLYKNKKLWVDKLLFESTGKFWPVLLINVLTKLVLYAGFIALCLPLLYSLFTQNPTAIIAANIFFLILFITMAISIEFLTAYATNFIVIKNIPIIEAIKEGWLLFSKNIVISLEIAFVLFFLKIASLIIIFSLFFFFLIPLILLLFVSLAATSLLGFVIAITLIVLAFTIISLLINSIYTVFYLSSWTIIFARLTEETLFGKIMDFIKKIPVIIKKMASKYHVRLDEKMLKKNTALIDQKLKKAYKEYGPTVRKQGKVAAKRLKMAYAELQPLVKKEAKRLIVSRKPKKSKKTIPKRK